ALLQCSILDGRSESESGNTAISPAAYTPGSDVDIFASQSKPPSDAISIPEDTNQSVFGTAPIATSIKSHSTIESSVNAAPDKRLPSYTRPLIEAPSRRSTPFRTCIIETALPISLPRTRSSG